MLRAPDWIEKKNLSIDDVLKHLTDLTYFTSDYKNSQYIKKSVKNFTCTLMIRAPDWIEKKNISIDDILKH